MAPADRHLRPAHGLRVVTAGLAVSAVVSAAAGALLLATGHRTAGVLLLCLTAWMGVGAPVVHVAWRSTVVEAERAVRAESERGIRAFATWLHDGPAADG